MGSSTDMNIILGQGNAIKEVQQVRRDHLELNQQGVSQQAEARKKHEKSRVQTFDAKERVTLRPDEEKKRQERNREGEKRKPKKRESEGSEYAEGDFIDIKV